jgi:hypothetical protein
MACRKIISRFKELYASRQCASPLVDLHYFNTLERTFCHFPKKNQRPPWQSSALKQHSWAGRRRCLESFHFAIQDATQCPGLKMTKWKIFIPTYAVIRLHRPIVYTSHD